MEEFFSEDRFSNLNKAVEEFKAGVIQTSKFNYYELYKKMEPAFAAENFRAPIRRGVDNILILRLDAVGDFVLTSAAIRELRANYPAAFITLVVRDLIYPLAEFCPYVNEILTFNFSEDILENFERSVDFARENLWKKHYNIAFSFRYWTDIKEMTLLYLSGAKERIGYFRGANGTYYRNISPDDTKKTVGYFLLTHQVIQPKKIINDVARSLFVLHSYGLKIRRTNCELWYSAEDVYKAENFLKDFAPGRMKIAVGLGGGHPARHYPVEKYLEAYKQIIDKGAALIIFGGPSETEDAKFLQDNLPAEFVKNITTLKLNWRETAALISLTELYIGNDTGTAHCAAAAKIPTITLSPEAKDRELFFERGLSQFAQYHPWQNLAIVLRPEHPLEHCKEVLIYSGCAEYKPHCITQINPAEIVKAFEEMAYFMKFSKIRKTGAPPVLTDDKSVEELFFKLDFN